MSASPDHERGDAHWVRLAIRATKCNGAASAAPSIEAGIPSAPPRLFVTGPNARIRLGAVDVEIELTDKYITAVSGTTGGLVGIYNRYSYLDEMRDAVCRYGVWLQSRLAQGRPERRDAPFEECCDEVSY